MSETPEFHIGREIEVKSSHVKFTPAKVIGSASNKDEIMLQYCSPDSTGVKQREAVKKTLLRPKQPVEIGRKFRYGELVDAFVDGCWCEGMIAEVSWDEKRFEVFLKCYNETHKFYAPDIRVHRDWIGGSWIPPLPKELLPRRIEIPAAIVKNARQEKPKSVDLQEDVLSNLKKIPAASVKDARREETPDLVDLIQEDALPYLEKIRAPDPSLKKTREKKEFSKGELVEVRIDEDGFRGAWFTASIINAVGNDRFLVEYHDLRNDEDTGNLKEEIDAKDMRPCPPERIFFDRFSLAEEVDAWYDGGWWEAKFARFSVMIDRVFFEASDEEIVFDHSNLRLRQAWIDNAWVMPSQASKRQHVR